MKAILGALALCGMVFAASANASGQTLIGEWHRVKISCEGGKVLGDLRNNNSRRIFDKASTTMILDRSDLDETFETTNCALHIKTNYQMSGNQYTVGPFLELSSPNCPSISAHLLGLMKYNQSQIKEKMGKHGETAAQTIGSFQRLKEGKAKPVEFAISNDNQQLRTFALEDKNDRLCPDSRYATHYERIK